MNFEKLVKEYFKKNANIELTKSELISELNINKKHIKKFAKSLNYLALDGKIIYKMGKYSYKENILIGKISMTTKGNAFFVNNIDNTDDIYISKENLKNAKHNDTVEIKLINSKTDIKKAEGIVLRTINRNTNLIVGTFKESKNYGFVIPDDIKINYDIFIAKGDKNGAKDNDKVVCKVIDFPDKRRNPEGVVVEVIGNKDNSFSQVISLLKENNIPYKFSSKIDKEIELIKHIDIKKEIKKRTDFRNLFTTTIDDKNSKDFDDAISIEKKDDYYILYTHIADVSFFVKKDSKIDKEALKRGNSVYLLDYVFPMLPEILSNKLCSLNPNVDRLALTVKIKIDKKGNVLDYKFYESTINSNYRLIYNDVSDYIEYGISKYSDDLLNEKLILMYELNDILESKRKKRGSIDFELPEVEIIMKEEKVIDIQRKQRRIANRIIESFMVLTNEVVGMHFSNNEVPILYRIHPKPLDEKVEMLYNYLKHQGISVKIDDLYSSKFISNLIDSYRKTSKSSIINHMILRSMTKAKYSTDIDIHFGLSSYFYCHFTSPIRRYADLTVHRSLKDLIHSNNSISKNYIQYLDIVSNHINDTEIKSIDVERRIENTKKVEYMKDKVGKVYEGIITSITSFGMFVQLNNTIEGLIRYEDMGDDYYIFNSENLTSYGKKNGTYFEIGMNVEIIVSKVNDFTNELEFILNRWCNEKRS